MNRCTAIALVLLPVLFIGGPALAGSSAPPQTLESYQACLVTGSDAIPVQLEQATSPVEHRYGLMERESLPEDAGMLFVYPAERDANAGFWMYRTRIPLDIAWLDDDGVILAMDTMTPCKTESARNCPSWAPGVRHRHVLEMNAGFFADHSVAVGDRLVANLNDNITCPSVD
ncbi:DUF192 domain-containing protein [Marinobacter zhanjiangensis]|uniref:DUF192 domain-containing protein n=1 Tax=Marinobacter zhanjiangensis TaxID=578215 RepID=A0ABQ3AY42_9GAMM|nr:DUF192 domain-containing protein [Marinobacter zhanjiangensis]GGY67500.1 hypothetical protein GCM10007071_13120 [Marinobacter zhanjiangensis]